LERTIEGRKVSASVLRKRHVRKIRPSMPGLAKTGTGVFFCFFKVEKNMFVTPVFYLGAERNTFAIALQHHSCKLVNLMSRGLPGKLGLISILAARGCLKHLFLSNLSQTTLQTLFYIWVEMFMPALVDACNMKQNSKNAVHESGKQNNFWFQDSTSSNLIIRF